MRGRIEPKTGSRIHKSHTTFITWFSCLYKYTFNQYYFLNNMGLFSASVTKTITIPGSSSAQNVDVLAKTSEIIYFIIQNSMDVLCSHSRSVFYQHSQIGHCWVLPNQALCRIINEIK